MSIECKMEFLQGEDGYYKKVTNPLFEAVIKSESNPEMPAVEESLTYHAKKIPGPTFRSWQAFCREVAAKNNGNSEAGLILMYHPVKKEWNAIPPKQDLSSVFVDFTGVTDAIVKFREKHGKEWLMAGTLHSHPGSAHPSTTDEEDEKKLDGVHIVIPDFGKEGEKGIFAHIVASKVRFVVKHVPGFLVDFTVPGIDKYPDDWISQCKFDTGAGRKAYTGGKNHGRGYGWTDGYGGYGGYGPDSGYGGGSDLVYKGEGPKTFRLTVDKVDMNVLAEQFENIEAKTLLKKLGFSKAQRKYLVAGFEDDLSDLIAAFDAARDGLKDAKEIKGSVSKNEHETIIDNFGTVVERILEAVSSISNRILAQAKDAPKDDDSKEASSEGEEEQEGGGGPQAQSDSDNLPRHVGI